MGSNNDFQDLSHSVHVCCVGSPEQVQGLQWALDHRAHSRNAYKVYRARLADGPERFDEFDFVVLFLDLGQPVPTEVIAQLASTKRGMCVFMQPTPGQLLALNEASDWSAVAWDGASYDEIGARVDRQIRGAERKIQNLAFISSAKKWIRKYFLDVDEIRIINARDEWKIPLRRKLDPSVGLLSIGGRQSSADIALPYPDDEIYCELHFLKGKWICKKVGNPERFQVRGDKSALGAGDEIEVNDVIFLLGRGEELEEFFGIARKLSILSEEESSQALEARSTKFVESELEGKCRALMYEQSTGELMVEDGHKTASIFFFSGTIIHCTTGAVSGLKALLRVMDWPDARWEFVNWSVSKMPIDSMRVDLILFTRALEENKKSLARVRSFVPPLKIHLRIKPESYLAKESWSIEECVVLAAIGEYKLVRDILNFCALPDAQIYETLVSLRRQGLIVPEARP